MININHSEYQKSLKKKTLDQLHFICRDAKAAHDANPNGEKAGYYLDEIHYCHQEITIRNKS